MLSRVCQRDANANGPQKPLRARGGTHPLRPPSPLCEIVASIAAVSAACTPMSPLAPRLKSGRRQEERMPAITLRTIRSLPVLLLAGGCGAATSTPGPLSLAAPVQVTSAGMVSANSTLQFTVIGGVGDEPATVNTAVTALSLRLITGERPSLTLMALPLGDMDVSGGAMPPTGLQLRELTVALREPAQVTVTRAETDRLTVTATVLFELHWAMRLPDGTNYALGPVPMAPMPLTLDVARDALDDPRVVLHTSCAGVCWRIEGVATVRDATLHAEATAAVASLD